MNEILYRKEIRAYRVGFAYAISDLVRQLANDDPAYPGAWNGFFHAIISGETIHGGSRIIQDRFARFCNECWLEQVEIDLLKAKFFHDWRDWS